MHVPHVLQLIVGVKQPILNHDRYFVFAAWQFQTTFFVIVNQNRARQTVIDLLSGSVMRMRMVNIHAGPIEHFKLVDKGLALVDRVQRMTIDVGWHVQAMPMGNCRFVQFVTQIDANFLAFVETHDRSEVRTGNFSQGVGGTFDQFGEILLNAGLLTWQYSHRRRLTNQVELDIRVEIGGRFFRCHFRHLAHPFHGA